MKRFQVPRRFNASFRMTRRQVSPADENATPPQNYGPAPPAFATWADVTGVVMADNTRIAGKSLSPSRFRQLKSAKLTVPSLSLSPGG